MDFDDLNLPPKKVDSNKSDTEIISKNDEKIEQNILSITKEMLPSCIASWVSDVCERIEAPFSLGVVNSLSIIGSLIGNRVAIKPKANDFNYLEYPNLWGCIIGSPSMKKTPVFNEISSSIKRIQSENIKEFEKDMDKYFQDLEVYEAKKKQHKEQLKKDTDNTSVFEFEKPIKPRRKIHYTQDATIEAIASLVDENPKGILVLRDELTGFLKNLDRQGNEEYRSFFLEGWSSGSKSIDRKLSTPIYIHKLTLSVLGNIQPSMIKPYIYESVKGHKADGLLQRFQLLVYAEDVEIKGIDRTPNTIARQNFDDVIKYVLETEQFDGADYNEYNKQAFYSYSKEAQEEFTKWYKDIHKEAKATDNEALESHLAKYPKLINSLALIFHICELSDGYSRNNYDISLENFTKALNLTNVLKSHAIKLYSIVEIEEQKKEEISNKIEEKIKEFDVLQKLPMSASQIGAFISGKPSADDVKKVVKTMNNYVLDGSKIKRKLGI